MHTKVRTMRKTIYVKDEKRWAEIGQAAMKDNKSVSEYLLGGSSSGSFGSVDGKILRLLELIDRKLDLVLKGFESTDIVVNKSEKRAKVERVSDEIPETAGVFFNPQPKGSEKGGK